MAKGGRYRPNEMDKWEEFKKYMLEQVCCYCSRTCELDSSAPATLACWADYYAEWVNENKSSV